MKRVGENLADGGHSMYMGSEEGRRVARPVHVAKALKEG